MTDERDVQEELARRLLAEEDRRHGARSEGRQATDAYVEALLEHERATERRLRHTAIGAWSAVLALVPLLGVAFFVVRNGAGAVVEVTRAAVIVVGIIAILAVFLAVLTTVAWLVRARAASLTAIERRLAALERLLTLDRRE